MRVSIIIPAFNEEGRLPATLERVGGYLAGRPWESEVIVVDDGSADGTADLADAAPGVTCLRNDGNRGKGYSVRRGMLAATGDVALMSDADLSTPIEDLDKLLARIDAGADIAIGSRAMRDSDVQIPQPIHRRFMGFVFRWCVRIITVGGFRDTQCGFKAFTAAAAKAVFERTRMDGFSFDVEVLYLARRLGLRADEVPVTWRDAEGSRVSPIRDSLRMFRDLLRIRWTHIGTK